MNHLTLRKPGCPTALPADIPYGGAALPAQGVCAVNTPPLDSVSTRGANEPQFKASFPAEREAISRVRHQLRTRLEEDGLAGVADDVVLICSELVANAVLHGCLGFPPGITVQVTVVWSDVQLRLDVRDPSGARPKEREFSASRTSGRGLRLVDELSDRWGVETDPSGSGKTVWTELDAPRRRAS
ncbi:ATP-binding protein [Streptomyces sp. NPDC006265]|uniref:ATP-binding protein n=1 Tax=Streptomyces sp. NPDC006265 TaxID=3156740 RepID=UPI0033AF605B